MVALLCFINSWNAELGMTKRRRQLVKDLLLHVLVKVIREG